MSDKLIEENDCGRNLFYEPQNANEKKYNKQPFLITNIFVPYVVVCRMRMVNVIVHLQIQRGNNKYKFFKPEIISGFLF